MLVAALLALAACGGGGSAKSDKTATPTATATATATAKAESGSGGKSKGGGKVNVKRFNLARLRLATACRKLKDAPADAASLRKLRQGTTAYLAEFKSAPDAEFKRNDDAPKATMRRMLVVTAAFLRASCGDGKAKAIGKRLSRAAHKRS
jgi:hypothetical protein